MSQEFKTYVVTAKFAEFHAGQRLQLTKEQAAIRKHNLTSIEGDIYEVTGPVQFKTSEQVGVAGDISKAQLSLLAAEGSEEAAAGSDEKPAAKAAAPKPAKEKKPAGKGKKSKKA